MDKTIRPDFGGGELPITTSSPAKNFETKVIDDLPPALYLVTGAGSQEFPLDSDEFIVSVGKSPDADITLNDETLSPIHMMMVKIKSECLFMDRGKRDLLEFNGIKTRQAFTPIESRMIIRVGQNILIYEACNIMNNVAIDQELSHITPLPQDIMPGKLVVDFNGQSWHSVKNTCLIGKHPICDIVLQDEHAADFSSMICWTREGINLERLGMSRSTISVNGVRLTHPHKLTPGCEVSIGNEKLSIKFKGDIGARCHTLFQHIPEKPEMALTVLNSEDGQSFPLAPNTTSIIGRMSSADVRINDPSLSRQHARVTARDKCLSIKDNGSYNKTMINREVIDWATVFPGDLIELGNCTLLAHYNVVRF